MSPVYPSTLSKIKKKKFFIFTYVCVEFGGELGCRDDRGRVKDVTEEEVRKGFVPGRSGRDEGVEFEC